jgi:hypothetical protein
MSNVGVIVANLDFELKFAFFHLWINKGKYNGTGFSCQILSIFLLHELGTLHASQSIYKGKQAIKHGACTIQPQWLRGGACYYVVDLGRL